MVFRFLAAIFLLAPALRAAVMLGSTRAEVIAEHGEPRGSTKAGSREILLYPNGRVILENGLVTDLTVPAKPAPPAAPSASAAEADKSHLQVNSVPAAVNARNDSLAEVKASLTGVPSTAPWYTDFATAKAVAAASKKRILVLFTGTDWCAPCQEFQAQVAYNKDFLRMTEPSFVLLKINWLRNTPQPKAEADQTAAMREQYGIATFPSLLVLAADGTQLTRVDTRKARPAANTADFYIQAVDEARVATRDGKPVKSSWFPF